MTIDFTIEGIQEAQRANLDNIRQLQPRSTFGRAIKHVTVGAQRHMVSITHVVTGSLRASERMKLKGLQGEIYIDPSSVNPMTRERPAVYGVIENARGGDHAFMDRTVAEAAPELVDQARVMIIRSIR